MKEKELCCPFSDVVDWNERLQRFSPVVVCRKDNCMAYRHGTIDNMPWRECLRMPGRVWDNE